MRPYWKRSIGRSIGPSKVAAAMSRAGGSFCNTFSSCPQARFARLPIPKNTRWHVAIVEVFGTNWLLGNVGAVHRGLIASISTVFWMQHFFEDLLQTAHLDFWTPRSIIVFRTKSGQSFVPNGAEIL